MSDCCDAVEFTDPIAQVIVEDDCTTVVQVTNTTGPQGPPGTAATVNVGTTSTLAPGSSATVTNTGTTSAAVFDFGIPEGIQGIQGPQGIQGVPGNAATVNVGATSTLTPGSSATVTNSGTTSAAVFDFGIPEGIQGIQGPAATVNVGTTSTLAPGSPATVVNSGTTSAAIFDFGVPEGQQGIQGLTGDTGIEIDATPPVNTAILWVDTGDPGDMVIPPGGAQDDLLAKNSAADYDTGWVSPSTLAGNAAFTGAFAPLSATKTISSISASASLVGLPNTLLLGAGNRNHPASTLCVWPFAVTVPVTITDWLADVRTNTSVGTETLRAGIYNFNEDYSIGSLVSEFPTLTVPTGTGIYVTSLVSSLNLPGGLYAIAWNVSATTFTLRTPQAATAVQVFSASNTSPARFAYGANGTVSIASPLPATPAVTTPVIGTDGTTWGPSVLPIWSYT